MNHAWYSVVECLAVAGRRYGAKKKAEFSAASFWAVLFDAVPGCEFGYRVLVFAAGFTNDKRNVFAASQLEVWM